MGAGTAGDEARTSQRRAGSVPRRCGTRVVLPDAGSEQRHNTRPAVPAAGIGGTEPPACIERVSGRCVVSNKT